MTKPTRNRQARKFWCELGKWDRKVQDRVPVTTLPPPH